MSTEATSSDTGEGNSSSKTSHRSTTSLTPSIEKLEGSMATGQSNYNSWRFRIIRILKEKDLLEAIEDSSVSTTKDDQAFTIITLNIKDSQIPHIQDATTAQAAWKLLRDVHQGIGTSGRMVLMQRLWGLKIVEGQDMAEHLNQFRELANQLRGLSTENKGLDDSELLTIWTLSLPTSYQPLVIALQSRSDQIPFDVMAGRLLQESARRHIGQVTHRSQDSNTGIGSNTAFAANRLPANQRAQPGQSGFHIYGRGRGGTRGTSRGYYGGGQAIRGNGGAGRSRVSGGNKCHYCGKEGQWKKDCHKPRSDEAASGTNNTAREFTFLAETHEESPSKGWIIDSGAGQHLCGDRSQFSTYSDISSEQAITIADGTKIQAKGQGEIEKLTTGGSIILTDVWHVPEIGGNLMSVSRMVDSGYKVEFGPIACAISKAGVRRELGHRYGRLYYLTNNKRQGERNERVEANLGLASNRSGSTTIEVWHRRFCHRTLDDASAKYISAKVRDMDITDKEKQKTTICGICAVGRQHKESTTGVREMANEVLEIVHSDLCGPMQTIGLSGERYFITFIDERSGRISLSLLRTKDKALTAFQVYKARAERSTGKEIKVF